MRGRRRSAGRGYDIVYETLKPAAKACLPVAWRQAGACVGIVLTGDIHGDTRGFARRLLGADGSLLLHEGDTLVCLGDVSVKYGERISGDLLGVFSALPCDVVVMRGNHDTRYWRDMRSGAFAQGHVRLREWGGGLAMYDERHPNVLYVPDEGGLFQIDGESCLFVPGAFSVDGMWRRVNGWPFEYEEQLTKDEMAVLLDIAGVAHVDYVFSHTCPDVWEPRISDLFLPGMDQRSVDKRMERWMDELLEVVRRDLKGWFFGHFHDDRVLGASVPARMLYYDVVRLGE